MLHSRVHIESGDMVILYFSRENMIPITVTAGEFFHNKYGRYSHDDMIGMKYGSKVHSPPPHSGYLHLLRPTPELWTLSLPHRTQILYQADIAYINARLGIRPGTSVIEAGTGSGSMTHTLSRGVGSKGIVRSYEYHQTRFEKAGEEFSDHGLHNVRLQHRNVCREGFGDAENIEAVFLDLPVPWEAIPHAINTFNENVIARICCFSPCLEQVLKTVSTLRSEGFHDISTQEVLIRNHDLVNAPSTAPPLFRSVTSLANKLQRHERKKEERRLIQMKTAREKSRKVKELEQIPEASVMTASPREVLVEIDVGEGGSAQSPDTKKRTAHQAGLEKAEPRSEEFSTASLGGTETGDRDRDNTSTKTTKVNGEGEISESMEDEGGNDDQSPAVWVEPDTALANNIITKPAAETRGHTSYLTFACYYPAKVRMGLRAQEEPRVPAAGDRIAMLAKKENVSREGSQDTDYGDDGLDQVMGTLTEEEIIGLGVPVKER